uniref:Uncharacterized protein n=1 Tax=Arundo donax TaxID=35708 RepID=A0A0A9C174_ARUDO
MPQDSSSTPNTCSLYFQAFLRNLLLHQIVEALRCLLHLVLSSTPLHTALPQP